MRQGGQKLEKPFRGNYDQHWSNKFTVQNYNFIQEKLFFKKYYIELGETDGKVASQAEQTVVSSCDVKLSF